MNKVNKEGRRVYLLAYIHTKLEEEARKSLRSSDVNVSSRFLSSIGGNRSEIVTSGVSVPINDAISSPRPFHLRYC